MFPGRALLVLALLGVLRGARAACDDLEQNGDETDVDCGGWECGACAAGLNCSYGGDCASGACDGGVCLCSCHDDGCALLCEDGDTCAAGGDCDSGNCFVPVSATEGECASCSNSAQDGDETGPDCGGDVCEDRCAVEEGCEADSDCASGACTAWSGVCGGCYNLEQDGRETDIDCGGSPYGAHDEDDALEGDCPPCPNSWFCAEDSDCWSGLCVWGECQSCTDGERQGDETDEDCGGSTCDARCEVGHGCRASSDCDGEALCLPRRVFSGEAADDSNPNGFGICSLCYNGEQDGDETDEDCGGSCGLLCEIEQACLVGPDCASGYCKDHQLCAEPPTPVATMRRVLEDQGADARYLAPALGDLDGDGVPDLALGTSSSGIRLLRGAADGGGGYEEEPEWQFDALTADAEQMYWKPTLGDIDGDGDLDIVAGSVDGDISIFLNAGDAWWPLFEEVPDWATDWWVTHETTDDGLGSFAAPLLYDLDGDDDLDLIIGVHTGKLDFLENVGWSSAYPEFVQRLDEDNPFDGHDFGQVVNPAFCDVDGDLDADLNLGLATGKIAFVENSGTASRPLFLLDVDNSFDPWAGVDVGLAAAPACLEAGALLVGALDAVLVATFSDCTNGVLDGTETAVDCGGEACGGCDAGEACAENGDCDSGLCFRDECVEERSGAIVAVAVCGTLAVAAWLFVADGSHSDYVRGPVGHKDAAVFLLAEITVLVGCAATLVSLACALSVAPLSQDWSALLLVVWGGAFVCHALARAWAFALVPHEPVTKSSLNRAGLSLAPLLDLDALRLVHWVYPEGKDTLLRTFGFPTPGVLRLSLASLLLKDATLLAAFALCAVQLARTRATDTAIGFLACSLALKLHDKAHAAGLLCQWERAPKVTPHLSPQPSPAMVVESLRDDLDDDVEAGQQQQPPSQPAATVTRDATAPTASTAAKAKAAATRKKSKASGYRSPWRISGGAKLPRGKSRKSIPNVVPPAAAP